MIDERPINERPRLCGDNPIRQPDGSYVMSEACKPEASCWCCATVAAPLECVPCRFCNSRLNVYCEMPINGDHHGRGFVMRIGCLCDESLKREKDENRTEFENYAEAIRQWNEMQREGG